LLEKEKHIDNLFADYLGEYEEKAPGYIWHNIQMELKIGKARKRASIIRAIAASVALFIAFGLGYYFSDFSKKQQYTTINPKSNQELAQVQYRSNEKQNETNQYLSDNYPLKNLGYTDKKSEFVEKNINNTLIFKLFDKNKNIYSQFREIQKNNSLSKVEYKKHSDKKTSNQLLIDTLLFKKEDLSERGFLLLKDKNYHSRWSLGTKFSPVYSMAQNMGQSGVLSNTPVAKSVSQNVTPDTKADEKSLMSFSGGINVNYHLTRRWSLESGVFYSEYRQMAKNLVSSSIFGFQEELTVYTPEGIRFVQPGGMAEPAKSQIIGKSMDETYFASNMDYKRNFEYIELPLIVRYKIIDRKFGLDVLSGVTTNFLIGNKSSIIYNDNDLWTGTNDGISPMLYNATIGVGLNYDLFKNLSLNIEPTFKYSLTLDEPSSPIKYPYRFAVFAGFSYRF
jgi:hypothetical protein